MKLRNTILNTTLILYFTLAAKAGTQVGNGDYCEQKGADCQRVAFRISGQHPEHDRIVELIQKAELPRLLKQEMLRDLEETQVVYSGEKIKFNDLVTRYEMQLTEVKKKTIRDRYGNVLTEQEIEKWERVALLPKLGIFISTDHPGYSTGKINNLWVRAITQTNPNKVIYFEEFTSQLTPDELIKLVLHEQAHRLDFLRVFHNDERVVEGWAQELYNYLTGKITKEQFYNGMLAFKLDVYDTFSFGTKIRSTSKYSYIEIPFTLSNKNIVSTRVTTQYLWLGISKESLAAFPGLNTKDHEIGFYIPDLDSHKFLDSILNSIISGQYELDIKIKVYFYTKFIERNGIKASKDVVEFMESSTEHIENIYLNIQNRLSEIFPNLKDLGIYTYTQKIPAHRGESYYYSSSYYITSDRSLYANPVMAYMPNLKLYINSLDKLTHQFKELLIEKLNKGERKAKRLVELLNGDIKLINSKGDLFQLLNFANIGVDYQTINDFPRLHTLVINFSQKNHLEIVNDVRRSSNGWTTYHVWSIKYYVNDQLTDVEAKRLAQSAYEKFEY